MGERVSRQSFQIIRAWIALAITTCFCPTWVYATEWDKLAKEYADSQIRLWTSQQTGTWYQHEAEQLKRHFEPLTTGELATSAQKLGDDEVRAKLAEIIKSPQGELVAGLEQLRLSQAEKLTQAETQWQMVLAKKFASDHVLSGIQSEESVVGEIAFLFSVENFWFWLSGLIALGSLAIVAAHDRRHELRRMRYGGRTAGLWINAFLFGSMAFVGVIVLVLFFAGDSVYSSLVSMSSGNGPPVMTQIAEQITEAKKEADSAELTAKKSLDTYQKEIENCRKGLEEHKVQGQLVSQWQESRNIRQQVDVQLAVEKQLSAKIKTDIESLQVAQEQIVEKRDSIVWGHRLKQMITAGLGGILLGITAFGGLAIQRMMQSRRRKTESTCPMCLGEGTFEEEAVGGLGAAGANLKLVRCNNLVDNNPCDFRFAAKYVAMEKLCFPTLGVPSSGKTHWLAMAYRQLQHRNYPDSAKFLRIHSPSAEDFDRLVDDILNSRFGTQATQVASIPFPLIFHFTDSDRPFESSMLVNVFDYSGEVTQRMRLEDAQRQRALNGDGYFLFLDPTKSSDEQQGPIERFQDDLYQIKNIELGGTLHTPVAICLSKIDLLNNQSYADDTLIAEFYRALSQIGWGYDLASVKARSNLVRNMCEVIWPGWDIERQMRGLFGDRFMFFPLTPVGLNELGVTDLDQRTISPVGVLQPVLWLLHMNGYPVLKRKA